MFPLDQIAVQVIGWCITAVLAAVSGYLVGKLKKANTIDKAMQQGIKAVLRRELVLIHEEHCIKKIPISIDDKDQATDLYAAYHELGGNGTIAKIYQEILELPVKRS